jgi:hypothetical protein
VVAVVGNRDAALDGSLEDGFALFDGDRLAVDRQRDSVHIFRIITAVAMPRRRPTRLASERRFTRDSSYDLRLTETMIERVCGADG